MTKYEATLYPSVESDYYTCEADSLEEAQEIIQGYSDNNYGFIVCNGDVKEIEESKEILE